MVTLQLQSRAFSQSSSVIRSSLLDELQKTLQENLRALLQKLCFEEAFNGLFDFSIASKVPSGKILRQSQKQMKVNRCEIRTGGWLKRSQPKVAIQFCIGLAKCRLSFPSNNRTLDLISPDRYF
ncbi:hypothetical protein TNCV_4650931 [Trichonephila clavipes]|nr:hypothetical protein TNCV_4650931 [Trichonephila clavipes]